MLYPLSYERLGSRLYLGPDWGPGLRPGVRSMEPLATGSLITDL